MFNCPIFCNLRRNLQNLPSKNTSTQQWKQLPGPRNRWPRCKESTLGTQMGIRSGVESVIPWATALLILWGFKVHYYDLKKEASFYFLMPKCFQPYDFILSKSHRLYFSSLPKIPKIWEEDVLKKNLICPQWHWGNKRKLILYWKTIRLKIT